jgi:hypothetical protein
MSVVVYVTYQIFFSRKVTGFSTRANLNRNLLGFVWSWGPNLTRALIIFLQRDLDGRKTVFGGLIDPLYSKSSIMGCMIVLGYTSE